MSGFLAAAITLHTCLAALTLDESPAQPGQWGFRPVGNAQTALNPPAFTWRPVGEATAYSLQVARDESFGDIVHEVDNHPWSSYCPSETLPEGKLFWRYRAMGKEDTSAWSETRDFIIPSNTVVFPKPSMAQMRARIPSEHPRLFFRPEEMENLKALANGPLASEWADVLERADKLLSTPPDTTEPPLYPPDMKVKSGAWKEMWWSNRTRTIAVVDGAATLAFAYRISDDERYGKAARDLLMAFASWDPKGSTQYQYNDEAAMPALYFPSRAYSWAYPMLSADDLNKIVEVMAVRAEDCFNHLRGRHHLWNPYASHSNRAWHFLGEVAIAFHDDIPAAPQWLDYAMTVFYTCYPVWGGSDGGWHEGLGYWRSYMGRFMYWAFNMKSVFGIDIFERPFFKKNGDFGMYALPPGSKSGAFGDQGNRQSDEGASPLMGILAAGAQNPYWKWYADTVGVTDVSGYLGFIYAARSLNLEGIPPTDLPSSKVFRGTGLAILNSNLLDGTANVQIHFKSSPYGRVSHGYNANNSFLLNINGQPGLTRGGRREVHGSPHHTKYMWHSRSDNAILVNGEGQEKHSAKATGYIAHFDTSDSVDVVIGEAGASYRNLDRWTRRIVFLKPYAFVVHDILEAPEPSTYQYNLHAPAKFDIEGQHARAAGDDRSVSVTFLAPEGLTLSQVDTMDPPPADWSNIKLPDWHLTADAASESKEQEFVALYVVNDADVTIASFTNGALKLDTPSGLATMDLQSSSFSVSYGDYTKSF